MPKAKFPPATPASSSTAPLHAILGPDARPLALGDELRHDLEEIGDLFPDAR